MKVVLAAALGVALIAVLVSAALGERSPQPAGETGLEAVQEAVEMAPPDLIEDAGSAGRCSAAVTLRAVIVPTDD